MCQCKSIAGMCSLSELHKGHLQQLLGVLLLQSAG